MSYDIEDIDFEAMIQGFEQNFRQTIADAWQQMFMGDEVVCSAPQDIHFNDGTQSCAISIRSWANQTGAMCGIKEFKAGWSVYFPYRFDPPAGSQALPGGVCVYGRDGRFYGMSAELFVQVFPLWAGRLGQQIQTMSGRFKR